MYKSHREVKELKIFKRLQMIKYRFNTKYVSNYLDFKLEWIFCSLNEDYSKNKRKYLNTPQGKLRISKSTLVIVCSIDHHGKYHEIMGKK